MNMLLVFRPGMLAVLALAAALFLPPAFAGSPGYGMGPGMMGGGMMGGGMMGQSSGNGQSSQISVNPKHAEALLAYIRKDSLPCTQCHSVSGNGVGPSFAAISANYAGRDDAITILQGHIARGFGRMPGGLATNTESRQLAKMIVDLEEPGSQ